MRPVSAPKKREAWRDMQPVLQLFMKSRPRLLLLGAGMAVLTVLMGMGLLGLSGWFITSTALAGLHATTAIVFDVFMPSAGIRLLAMGRTLSRYGERLVTHDATLAVLADLREQLFRGWARPEAARQLLLRPARLLFRRCMGRWVWRWCCGWCWRAARLRCGCRGARVRQQFGVRWRLKCCVRGPWIWWLARPSWQWPHA